MQKLCKDCKHHRKGLAPEFSKCRAPQNIRQIIKLIDGIPRTEYRWDFCSTQREDGWLSSLMINTCGKRGKWFEVKDET